MTYLNGFHAGSVQAGFCWRDRLQHEAVCRGVHGQARQAVQEVGHHDPVWVFICIPYASTFVLLLLCVCVCVYIVTTMMKQILSIMSREKDRDISFPIQE